MKIVLRCAASVLAVFLLLLGSVSAFAAAPPFPEDENGVVGPPVENGGQGDTFFGVMEVSKWKYLTVLVKDSVTTLPLPGITVKLFQGASEVPITGSSGGFATGEDGKIVFRLVKDDTIPYHIEITPLGFEGYVGSQFTLPDRLTEQTIELVPIYHTVSYFSGDNGSLDPSTHTEQVRWGDSPKAPPKTVPSYRHRFLHWTLGDVPVNIPSLQVKDDISLYAQFGLVPQYNVYYITDGHGMLSGATHELVWEGERPVNAPSPWADEYDFNGWQEQGKPFVSRLDPHTVVIMGETTFVATFTHSPKAPQVPLQPLPDGKPPRVWFPETDSSVPEVTDAPDQSQVPNAVPETLEPVVKLLNLDVGLCWLHWLILALCLLTGFAGILRLCLLWRHPKKSKKKSQKKPDMQTRMRRHRWMVFAEVVAGAVCSALWGVLFAIRICRWDIIALMLWAIVILVLAVLLVRAERQHRELWGTTTADKIEKQ